jgi:hypothetical protein
MAETAVEAAVQAADEAKETKEAREEVEGIPEAATTETDVSSALGKGT